MHNTFKIAAAAELNRLPDAASDSSIGSSSDDDSASGSAEEIAAATIRQRRRRLLKARQDGTPTFGIMSGLADAQGGKAKSVTDGKAFHNTIVKMKAVHDAAGEDFRRLVVAVGHAVERIPARADASVQNITVFMSLLTDTAKQSLCPPPRAILDLSGLPRLPKLTASMRTRAQYVRDRIYNNPAYVTKSVTVLRFMHMVFRYLGSQQVWEHRGICKILEGLGDDGANFEIIMQDIAKMAGEFPGNELMVQSDGQRYPDSIRRCTGDGKMARNVRGIPLLAVPNGMPPNAAFGNDEWEAEIATYADLRQPPPDSLLASGFEDGEHPGHTNNKKVRAVLFRFRWWWRGVPLLHVRWEEKQKAKREAKEQAEGKRRRPNRAMAIMPAQSLEATHIVPVTIFVRMGTVEPGDGNLQPSCGQRVNYLLAGYPEAILFPCAWRSTRKRIGEILEQILHERLECHARDRGVRVIGPFPFLHHWAGRRKGDPGDFSNPASRPQVV